MAEMRRARSVEGLRAHLSILALNLRRFRAMWEFDLPATFAGFVPGVLKPSTAMRKSGVLILR
jgi:hypothetical protein